MSLWKDPAKAGAAPAMPTEAKRPPGRPRKTQATRRKQRQFRASDEEYAVICEAAALDDLDYSNWLRMVGLKAARERIADGEKTST